MATHTNMKQIPPRKYTGTRRVADARAAVNEEIKLRAKSEHMQVRERAYWDAVYSAREYRRLSAYVKSKYPEFDLDITPVEKQKTIYQENQRKKFYNEARSGKQHKPKENCLLCSKLHKSRQCPLTKDWVDLSDPDTGYSVFEPSACTYWKREDFLNSIFSALLSNSFRGGKTKEESDGLAQEWNFACSTFLHFGDIGVFAFAKNTTRWCTSRTGVRSFAVACKDYQVFQCIAQSNHELLLKLQCFKEHYILGEDNLLGLFELGRM